MTPLKIEKDFFGKQWKKLLIDIDKTETDVAKDLGVSQSNLNRKMRSGSIKAVELAEILDRYGYALEIRKKGVEEK